jgi:hypothetical protein
MLSFFFNSKFEIEACLSQVYALAVDTEAGMKPVICCIFLFHV